MDKSYPPLPPKTSPSWCPDPPSLQQGAVSLLRMLCLPSPVLAEEVVCLDVCGREGIRYKICLHFQCRDKSPLVWEHEVMFVLQDTRFS